MSTYNRICAECNSRVCEHAMPVDRSKRVLTAREVEVLKLLSGGLCNKEIATTSNISVFTVKITLQSVYRKLGVSSRLEAALYVVRNPDLFEESK